VRPVSGAAGRSPGSPPFTVLHVCMGNICRSPMAERLLVLAARTLVGDKVTDLIHVHGAGTGGWHVGEPMDAGAARQVRRRGGDVDGFAARKLAAEYLDGSDLILAATGEQRQYVVSVRPDAASRTFVLGEFGRLLPGVDLDRLPPYAADPGAVYARGVALVEAVDERRGDRPPRPEDDLDDPWGRGERVFGRVADRIERTVVLLARALLT
jgi:protein-tyrosine phosphatase